MNKIKEKMMERKNDYKMKQTIYSQTLFASILRDKSNHLDNPDKLVKNVILFINLDD